MASVLIGKGVRSLAPDEQRFREHGFENMDLV